MTIQFFSQASGRRKAWLSAGVGAMLVGVLLATLLCIETIPTRQLIACWTNHLHTPLVADNLAAANDEASLCTGDYFDVEDVSLDDIVKGNSRWNAAPKVIYVSAHATCSDDGKVMLLSEEYSPLTMQGGVAFDALLQRIDSDPSPKLLVLDLSWNLAEGSAGMLPCGVGQAVHDRLAAKPPKRCLTLVSCGPEESPTWIESAGRTTFGYFFEKGLAGAADSYNKSGITDGRITANELAAYVTDRVTLWSQRYGATPQCPVSYASGAADLVLMAARRDEQPLQDVEAIEAYPEWLLEAWRRRDAWHASGEAAAIPRLVKRYEAELIEAEDHWRWNVAADHCERWQTNSNALLQEIESARHRLHQAPIVSLAQLTVPADPAHVDAWLTFFAAPDKEAARSEFSKVVEGVSYESLAQSALKATLESGEGLREALSIVKDELRKHSILPSFTEVADLQLLAEVAALRPDASPAVLAEFLRVATLRAQVAADDALAETLVSELDRVGQTSQSAWAALISPGYASLEDACDLNKQALRGYQAIAARQKLHRRSQQVLDRALATLPKMTPVLRVKSGDRDEWIDAVQEADQLLSLLETGVGQDDKAIDAAVGKLEQRLERLMEIACAESVSLLAKEVGQGDLRRATLAQALLATPLLKADDRATLVTALREAEYSTRTQLSEFTHGSQDEDPLTDSAASLEDERDLESLAIWEADSTVSLLRLAGLLDEKRHRPTGGPMSLTALRTHLADAHEVGIAQLPAAIQRRACYVLPPHSFHPLLDKRDYTPTLMETIARRGEWARRYASRISVAAKDLHDPSPYLDIARRIDRTSAAATTWLRVGGATDGVPVVLHALSLAQPTESLTVEIEHPAGESPNVEVLQPADCLLVESNIEPTSFGSQVRLDFRIREDASIVQQLATHGVLLVVRRGAEVSHRRVATPGVAGVSSVELLVEMAGVRMPWAEKIELPPTVKPTAMRLIALNHSDHPLAIQADIDAGLAMHAEAVIEAGGETALKLSPLNLPTEGATAAQQVSKLKVALREGSKEIISSTARLGVADPVSYLKLQDARYINDGFSAPRLRFVVQRLDSTPSQLNVLWNVTSEGNPSTSVVKGGAVAASVTNESPIVSTEAELAHGSDFSGPLQAIATINGVVGAVTFVGDVPFGTRSTVLARSTKPALQLKAPTLLASGAPLAYSLDAYSAPSGVTLETKLVPADADESLSSIARHRFPAPRRHTVTMTAPGEAGDCMVESTIGAWGDEFDTTGLSGRWRIVAVAINPDGVVVARAASDVVIDGEPPSRIALSPQGQLVAAKPAAFRIDAADELSGVSIVRVYIGEPVNSAPPADAKPVVAAPLAGQLGAWSATLPLPEASTAMVTVEVTDHVGQVRNESRQLVLMDEAGASLGSVTGTVVEGVLPQPNLLVELRDPQQQPVASSKTDANGAFSFAEVKPGKYLVWTVKAASQRVDAAAIEVQPGAEAKVDLKLSL